MSENTDPAPTAENDVTELADEVARILHPHSYLKPDERGRYTIERPANGNDSTMHVYLATDGHNSMRALTYREVCEAVLASDWFKARVTPPANCPECGTALSPDRTCPNDAYKRLIPPGQCPDCGEPVYVAAKWGEWACSDPECVRAHGPGPGGGYVIPPGEGDA